MNVLTFDIETIPDTEGGARLLGLEGLAPAEVAAAMFHERRVKTGRDFLQHHLHRVVAIAVALRADNRLKVWSLGTALSDEADLIRRFFDGLERYTPTLVSWNGGGFNLPVLHYRALVHGIQASRYWASGDEDPGFRFNSYINRFHERHTDVMDVLSGFQARATVGLDSLATLLGFPGKLGMSGARVFDEYQAGNIDGIRNYCETDVLNTYLVFLRFQLLRGRLDDVGYAAECGRVREMLAEDGRAHLKAFAEAWPPGVGETPAET